ncbi:MAG: (deoxy)nucleoside triphosphate pyrophosphohydrolase [Candidatus Marinimicrobia bacterium]|nr:(deoxy)nucleoside triphosphate pyrophosphohydrolase [Candidatus Neomarinimicrobiota bacterium]
MLHVVAGIIEIDGYILLCQRHRDSARFPLKWEFPGGKVEMSESPEDAIKRELKEELGIFVNTVEKIEEYSFSYGNEPDFRLHFFRILEFENTPQNLQFETIAWLLHDNLLNYDLLEGDLPFVKRKYEGKKARE